MKERLLKIVSSEHLKPEPAGVALNYIDAIMAQNINKELPFTYEDKSPGAGFALNTKLEDTHSSLPFVKNGILIAVFNLIHLPTLENGEGNIGGEDNFELRQIKGVIDIYRPILDDVETNSELCTSEEKNLLVTAIQILNDQKAQSQ